MPKDARIDSTPTLLGIAPVGPARAPYARMESTSQPEPQRTRMYPQRSQEPQAQHAPARARAAQAAQPQPRSAPARAWPPQHATVKHAPLATYRAPMHRESPLASPRSHEPPMYRESPFEAAQPVASGSSPLPVARISLAQVPTHAAHAAHVGSTQPPASAARRSPVLTPVPAAQAAPSAPALEAAPMLTPAPAAQRPPALTPVPRRPSQPRVAVTGPRVQILPRAPVADPTPLPRSQSQPTEDASVAERARRPLIWILAIAALTIAGPEYLLFSGATLVIWSAIRFLLRDRP